MSKGGFLMAIKEHIARTYIIEETRPPLDSEIEREEACASHQINGFE